MLEEMRRAYEAGEHTRCLHLSARVLSSVRAATIPVAGAYYYQGNVYEILGANQPALRSWTLGLAALDASGIDGEPLRTMLSTAIEGALAVPRVFLSHASTESDLAHRLREQLEARGLRCIDYRRDFVPGERIDVAITEALRRATCTLVLWSAAYQRRPYCIAELEMARRLTEREQLAAGDMHLVLLRVDETPVPEQLRDRSWIDREPAAAGEIGETTLERLLVACRRRVWKKDEPLFPALAQVEVKAKQ